MKTVSHIEMVKAVLQAMGIIYELQYTYSKYWGQKDK